MALTNFMIYVYLKGRRESEKKIYSDLFHLNNVQKVYFFQSRYHHFNLVQQWQTIYKIY